MRLCKLEDRLVPTGINSLINPAEPSLYSDTGARGSYVGYDPVSLSLNPYARAISQNGRYVAYLSTSPNLVVGQTDTNSTYDVFLLDRLNNSTELISHQAGASATAANGSSYLPVISADGRFVAFVSTASNLIASMSKPAGSDTNVFVYDRQNDICTLVSHSAANSLLGSSYDANGLSISAQGTIITFTSQATNLTSGFPDDGSGVALTSHAYVYDCSNGQVTLIDRAYGSTTNPGNDGGSISFPTPDGRYVLVDSYATNLLANTTTSKLNSYLYDRQTSQLKLLSNNTGTTPLGGNGDSEGGGISDDGRWVYIQSAATNLSGGVSSATWQVYVCDTVSGQIKLVSHIPATPLTGGNAESSLPNASPDGRYVTFRSFATNLVQNFVDGNSSNTFDVYFYDRVTDQIALVSHQVGSTTKSGNSSGTSDGNWFPEISNDGHYVVFADKSTDLIAGYVDNNGTLNPDLYRYNRDTGTVTLVSGQAGSATIGSNGTLRTDGQAAMNDDGSVVAWMTSASNIMSGIKDTNGQNDVYLRDFGAGTTELVSVRNGPPSLTPGGVTAGGVVEMNQSADGRYVVFVSYATNLVPGQVDNEQSQDVFLRDRWINTTILVSHASGSSATIGNGRSRSPSISDDGRYVAYTSQATNLVAGFVDGNGPEVADGAGSDVFLFDRVTGTNTLVSHQLGSSVVSGNKASSQASEYSGGLGSANISPDGRYVAFSSLATDLVPGFVDQNGAGVNGYDLYVYDQQTGNVVLVSHQAGSTTLGANNSPLSYSAYSPRFSGDGQDLVYWSTATNLIAGMTGASRNVFLYDVATGTNVMVSHAYNSLTASSNGGSNGPVISNDGRYIFYQSAANNLVAGMVNSTGYDNGFLYDRITGQNVLISHAWNSATISGNALTDTRGIGVEISADGRYVVFQSGATNLVQGFVDNNGFDPTSANGADVYLYDRLTNTNTLISHSTASLTNSANSSSYYPQISRDGRFIAFSTRASDLVGGWTLTAFNATQVVLYDRQSATMDLVSHSQTGNTVAGNNQSFLDAISSNGSVVSIQSDASDLIAGDLNGMTDLFAYQRPPTVVSVAFGDGTNQRSLVRQLVVTFSESVSFMGSVASAFTVHRTGTNGTLGDVTLTANPSSGPASSVTITVTGSLTEYGSLVDGLYDVWVDAAQVSGSGGALDGNNDGIAGGSYHLVGTTANKSYRLFGDSNGDAAVDQSDYLVFRNAVAAGASVVFDFDASGDVDQTDYLAFRERIGMSP
ncbi:MAG: hypothetical protein ACJ8C4_18775 [Gemmataceae bacterium]